MDPIPPIKPDRNVFFFGSADHWRQDLNAGLLVSLIALPLCLGIAVASGFPPMAGLITAIVGGVLVSWYKGSCLTITGPAAGLIVVILGSVESLGEADDWAGYRYTLAAIVVSGGLQWLLGLFKAGRLAAFFPNSVVHGMLAAIGIIIMAKQLPVMAGVEIEDHGLLTGLARLPEALGFFIPQAAGIALVGLALLLAWPHVRHPMLSRIPAPLLVIVSGVLLGKVFDLRHLAPEQYFRLPEGLSLGNSLLVSIPEDLTASLVLPDFARIGDVAFWGSVISITLVGSLESLLSTAAVDKLDPRKRYSDLNLDLRAIGMGNMAAGLLGGLPMIAEIARSSANIDAGGQTRWSNAFHGVFLLIFVVLLPNWIGAIPLASLAALLVYTGYRLTSPLAFARTLDLGKEQLALFVITIAGVLAGNLLAGVAIGILAKLLFHIGRGVSLRDLLSISYHVAPEAGNRWVVRVSGSAIFSNFVSLKSELANLPPGGHIVFNLSEAGLIDHTVMEFIHQYRDDYIVQGGSCEILGLDQHTAYGPHAHSARNRPASNA
jgi:MFS superfamily sulfate permease-like transporter